MSDAAAEATALPPSSSSSSSSKRVVDSSKIWATLVTNTKYLKGLLTLNFSLKLSGSKYPLVVLYTDSLEPEGHAAIDARGLPKKRVEYLSPLVKNDFGDDTRFHFTWSKLQVFTLVEYERVVQLDSDMLVLKNMDELMDVPLDIEGDRVFASTHACVCNPLKKNYPKDWIPENCGYTLQCSNPSDALEKGAPCNFGLGMCNSGLEVINPSLSLYKQILATMSQPSKTLTYAFADQALISDTFKGRWVALSYKYNALKTLRSCHKEIWNDDEVKNIHYILEPKPWDDREFDEPTHAWWWEMNGKRLKAEERERVADGW